MCHAGAACMEGVAPLLLRALAAGGRLRLTPEAVGLLGRITESASCGHICRWLRHTQEVESLRGLQDGCATQASHARGACPPLSMGCGREPAGHSEGCWVAAG